ncbi:MAG: Ig-like domain-containing protein [Bdellovibrionales bacterium]|nr:Ig-like domain-containing protein [Bdellovibrionales bacterium]
MDIRKQHKKRWWSRYLLACLIFVGVLFGCSKNENTKSKNFSSLGSFAAVYHAESGEVNYVASRPSNANPRSSALFALDYQDTTGVTNPDGVTGGAIRDTTKLPGDIDYDMGLVDPDNCSTEYNPTTHTLSFYTRLINKSDYLDDGSPYVFTDPVDFPRLTTFYTPFHFVITGLDWDTTSYPGLITAINTDLGGASCDAQNGLTLATCDSNPANDRFDSIWPDNPINDYSGLPGYDFTPYITDGDMAPGDDTGCVLFMQFTLTENQDFTLYFDLLAVRVDGTPIPQPNVISPTTPSYVNTSTMDVTIDNCMVGRTLHVDGGESPVSVACAGTTQAITVTPKSNTINYLAVYQVNDATQEQSISTNLQITHDDISPEVVASSPADNQTSVNEYSNCVVTFSEPIDTSSVTSGSNCSNGSFRVCRGGNFVNGTISFSSDSTQAVYDPNAAMSTNSAHTCDVTTAVTDLAGNSLNSAYSAAFTTRNGAFGADVSPPVVTGLIPADNATVSVNTSFYVYFNEAINASTLIATDCDGGGTPIPNLAIWQTNSCITSGYPTTRPNPISGTVSINATGDVVTFTPNTALSPDDCLAVTISSCVEDLAGNALPNRGNFAIGAYGGNDIDYNTWTIFYTKSTSDSTPPVMVHTGPFLDAANVYERVYPFWIFSEPIDPATIITDYLFTNVFGSTTKISASVKGDPTLQLITLKPNPALTLTEKFVMTATGALTDASGNQMVAPQTSQFTVNLADTNTPTVVAVTPTNFVNPNRNPPRISTCTMFDVDFSEPMDTSTLHGGNIRLIQRSTGNVKPTTLNISNDGASVRLIPDSSLQNSGGGAGRDFRVEVSGVKDRAGSSIASDYTGIWYRSFDDNASPTVLGFAPTGSVSENGSFAVFFSESMDRSTLTNTNFAFGGGIGCPFQSVYPSEDGTWAVANCYHNMNQGSNRSLTLAGGSVKDRSNPGNNVSCENGSGRTVGGSPSITFTVGASDTTPPVVSAVNPSDGTGSVATTIQPSVTFNEEIDPRTITPTTVLLMSEEGEIVPSHLSISSDALTVTITPNQPLASSEVYYVLATTAIRDLGGGNTYDDTSETGVETIAIPGVLRTCFATVGSSCP